MALTTPFIVSVFGRAVEDEEAHILHGKLNWDHLFKSDSGMFQAFIGPHLGWINAELCVDTPSLASAVLGAKTENQCKRASGVGIGAQTGLIFQPFDALGFELGYEATWIPSISAKFKMKDGTTKKQRLSYTQTAYLAMNLSF